MNGMVEAEIWGVARAGDGNMVFLRPLGPAGQEPFPGLERPAPDYAVPIFVGQLEVQSILIGCGGIETPRPLTHDLLIAVLGRAGLVLRRVEVSEIRDNTFYARLILGSGADDAAFAMDSRPSDALALAVRVKCPICIDETVLAEAGVPISDIIDADTDTESAARRKILRAELDAAVAAEDYERAAELRDAIALLETDLPKT